VEARQRVEQSLTNCSIGSSSIPRLRTVSGDAADPPEDGNRPDTGPTAPTLVPASMTWWPWRGGNTRSHPELGRENPQRRWYFGSSRGRVGRRQVIKAGSQNQTFLQPCQTPPRGGAAR
jgi:hypothetical protein